MPPITRSYSRFSEYMKSEHVQKIHKRIIKTMKSIDPWTAITLVVKVDGSCCYNIYRVYMKERGSSCPFIMEIDSFDNLEHAEAARIVFQHTVSNTIVDLVASNNDL